MIPADLLKSRWMAILISGWVGVVALRSILPDPLFWNALVPAAQAGMVILAALGLGFAVLSGLRLSPQDGWERLFFGATTGLGSLALLVFGAGSVGLLDPAIWWVLITGLALWGIWVLMGDTALRSAVRRLRSRSFSGLEAVLLGTGAVALGLYFLCALAPPTFFDSMVYHLSLADRFVAAGRITVDPDFVFSFFPLNMEMLYTLGRILFDGHQVAGLLNYYLGLILVLGAACLGRRFGGGRAAILSAAVLILTPVFGLLAVVPKHDLALALFEVGAFLAWCRWWFDGRRESLILAGILAGFACGTKYAGIYFLLALLAATAIVAFLQDRKSVLPAFRGVGLALGLALVVSSPWWVRNTVVTGNPVYPTFQKLFPSAERLSPNGNRISSESGGRRDLSGLLRAPWDMTFHPEDFRLFSQIGPFYLAMLLPLLAGFRFRREIPLMLLTVALTAGFWWWTRPNTRYFLGCLVLLGAASAALLVRFPIRNRISTAALAGLVLLFPPLNLVAYLSVERTLFDSLGQVLGTSETETEYLTRRLDYYPAAAFINSNLPEDAGVMLVGETRSYYLERPVRVSSAHNRSLAVRWADEAGTVERLLAVLEREGVTHLLVNEEEGDRLGKKYAYYDFSGPRSRLAFDRLLQEKTCRLFSHRRVHVLAVGPCGERETASAGASR